VGYEDLELPQHSELVIYDGGRNSLNQWKFDTIELPRLLSSFGPDVIFAMGNVGLVKPPCPQAILFHKPHLVYPKKHYARERWQARLKNCLLKKRLKSCLKRTDRVFCQTTVSRDRFHRTFIYPKERIGVMPNAVSVFASNQTEKVTSPPVLQQNGYFDLFFLTKFYAHKNLEILLSLFRNHYSHLEDVRCLITIAPDQHPNAAPFLDKVKQHGLEKHIVNIGPISQQDLRGYFCNSDCLFFPSLMESFSGTYLEAMYFGLPILTSDLDFARYVCADAALYFNPWSHADIVEKILTIKKDGGLAKNLISKGKSRYGNFVRSWKDITADVISELETLAHSYGVSDRSHRLAGSGVRKTTLA
jgi:glycosyltransferase involved in cell wall biosynthesis